MCTVTSIFSSKITNQSKEVSVNVIATYQDSPQEIIDCVVHLTPLNTTISDQLSVELSVLSQIVDKLCGNKDYLQKISLCYELPEPDSYDEIVESGLGFIFRTNSKYWFCPDQTDSFEKEVIRKLKISSLVRPVVAQIN